MAKPQAQESAGFKESYSFEDTQMEPNPGQLSEDWDTMMEEYFDDYDDFRDINVPNADDDFY